MSSMSSMIQSIISLLLVFLIPETFENLEKKSYFYFPDYNHPGEVIKVDLRKSSSGLRKISRDESQAHFYLFTKNNPEVPQEIIVGNTTSVINSNFKPNEKLNLIIHGFLTNYKQRFPWDLRNLYLQLEEWHNVVLFDWSDYSGYYFTIVEDADLCSTKAKDFLEFLIKGGFVKLYDIHTLGHSAGAHLAGMIGYKMNGRLPRITALDPAAPTFEVIEHELRIDSSDAKFVDVIHTSENLGILAPLGHADFYPNGGKDQPGCQKKRVGDYVNLPLNLSLLGSILSLINTCAHSSSAFYYEESLFNPKGFKAYRCSSWDNYLEGNCFGNDIAYMGEFVDFSARGSFYLETNDKAPFGKSENSNRRFEDSKALLIYTQFITLIIIGFLN